MSAAVQPVQGLQVRKVHPHVGAEISGVDLREPLPDDVFEAIRDAFHQHSILVFRDQDIDDAQQVAFSQRFGELERTSFTVAASDVSANPCPPRLGPPDRPTA